MACPDAMGQKQSQYKIIMIDPEFCVYDVRMESGVLKGYEDKYQVHILAKSKKYVTYSTKYRICNSLSSEYKDIYCVRKHEISRQRNSKYYIGLLHIPLLPGTINLEQGPNMTLSITHINDKELVNKLDILYWVNPVSDHIASIKKARASNRSKTTVV